MKLKTALEEMEVVLNELNEQFENLSTNEVRVPQIELDIIMATMRRLYEQMSELNKMKHLSGVDPVKAENSTEKTEPTEQKETQAEVQEIKADYAITDTEERDVTKDFLKEIDEEKEKKTDAAAKKTPKPETQKPSLLLQFEDEIFSVNDTLAKKGDDKSVVNKLSNTRIENLKSAIGINDKFYFINELFAGNSQAYEDVIYTLNNFKRFEESLQYISTLKHRYDWDTDAEAYQKLIHFLERKFVEVHA
ncbi:MAG: hypothetical protein JW857_02855 [Bacteroidales bacterium]|nr:hypothetical protein [Bacteroidales bacterium]